MKVLSFGEILWDIFPDEQKMGGAPLNFAAHLVKNGVDTAIYSSVGDDELGKSARENVSALGIDTSYVATVPNETGVCLVSFDGDTPIYVIKADTALDNIAYMPIDETFDGFYFGTLAQRSENTRETLTKLLENNEFGEIFFDINIRQKYYTKEIVDFSLKKATVFKVSREEIGVLKELGISKKQDFSELCKDLCEKYDNLKLVIITLDKDGSLVYQKSSQKVYYSDKPKSKVVSTVGAGDSFSACFFANYLRGETIKNCLEKATKVSDFVVTKIQAIPDYPQGLLD